MDVKKLTIPLSEEYNLSEEFCSPRGEKEVAMRNQTRTVKLASHFEGDEGHPSSLFLPKEFEGDEGHPPYKVFDAVIFAVRLRRLTQAVERVRQQIEEEE